jgi:hypothetical protein
MRLICWVVKGKDAEPRPNRLAVGDRPHRMTQQDAYQRHEPKLPSVQISANI